MLTLKFFAFLHFDIVFLLLTLNILVPVGWKASDWSSSN